MTQDKDMEIAASIRYDISFHFDDFFDSQDAEEVTEVIYKAIRSVREEAVRDAQISVWNEAIERCCGALEYWRCQQIVISSVRSLKRPQSGEEK